MSISTSLPDSRFIKSVFEAEALHRRDAADSDVCGITELKSLVDKWRRQGSHVVFTAGVFDVLHVNHILALTHYRLLAAERYLSRSADETANVRDVAASSRVRLVVSVDSDKRVEKDKAFVVEKGGSPKPLVSWENRTLMLLKQYMPGSNQGTAVPLVDFVTKHGQDTCLGLSCAHDDNVRIAEKVLPDMLVVSSGSPATIAAVKASPRLAGRELVVIEESGLFYFDALLGGPVKSSAIIKRAKA